MQVVILAAGQGTRMGPLTAAHPKPMLPVAGQPLVAGVADAAIDAGATELVVTVGYQGSSIEEYLGSERRGVPVAYAEQSEQVGTADAVAAAAERIDGPFAVLNGDILYDAADLAELFSGVPRIGTYRVDDPTSYGVVLTDNGMVTGIVEKPEDPPSRTINAGAYTFPADAVDLLDVPVTERGERELTDVLDRLIDQRSVRTVPFTEWMDVGHPWELLEANERRLQAIESRQEGSVHPNATIEGPVVVEEGATVGSGVVIEGPALLGADSSIGPNAYLRGPVAIGPGAHVGHAVEVKRSVLMADASVGHLSYVGDSVLGRGVNFGAGTNVANLRHDGAPVSVSVGERRVSTGRRKFGVVAGPDSKTGIDTSLNAGVTLAAGSRTAPGETVFSDVE